MLHGCSWGRTSAVVHGGHGNVSVAPPLLLFALNLPRRLVATADDLSVIFRPPHGDFLDFTIHFQPCNWRWMAEEVDQQQPSQKMAQRLSTQTCQSQPFSVTSVTSMHTCSFKQNFVNISNVKGKVREAQENDAISPACACMSQQVHITLSFKCSQHY
jgi:hypothetical protein